MLLSTICKISLDDISLFNEVPPTLDWRLQGAEKSEKCTFTKGHSRQLLIDNKWKNHQHVTL